MKTPRLPHLVLTVLASSTLALPLRAQDQEDTARDLIGRTLPEVRADLGEPRATLKHQDLVIAHFDSSKITFKEGVAVEAVPVDPAEREGRLEMLQRINEEKREVGQRLRDRYQASGELEQLSPTAQLEFWQSFQRKYPEVDIGSSLARAQNRVEAQEAAQRQADQEAQIAYLEGRLESLQYGYNRLSRYSGGSHFGFRHGKHFHRHRFHRRGGDRDGIPPSNDPNNIEMHRTPAGSVRGVAPIISSPPLPELDPPISTSQQPAR